MPTHAENLEDIIKVTFRNAVVKINVSSLTPVIEGGKNLCLSEGTGFLISQNHVATAKHIFDVDKRCGRPTILLQSRRHNVTRMGRVLASADDVALVLATEDFPAPMCALGLNKSDVYDVSGIRFGIPGQLQDPSPLQVAIGDKDSEWKPLVRLIGQPAELGESGGPVIYYFNVVGILKAKHKSYTGYSFMMVASSLKRLLATQNVTIRGRICNPVETYMAGPNAAELNLQPNPDLNEEAQGAVLKLIQESAAHAATNVPEISASLDKSKVTISAREKIVPTQECTLVRGGSSGRSICTIRYKEQPARDVADDATRVILEDTTTKLWRSFRLQ